MIETLETICLWVMISAGVIWIASSLAVVEALSKDRERMRRVRRNRRT